MKNAKSYLDTNELIYILRIQVTHIIDFFQMKCSDLNFLLSFSFSEQSVVVTSNSFYVVNIMKVTEYFWKQYNTKQYNAKQNNVIRHNSIQYNTQHYNIIWNNTINTDITYKLTQKNKTTQISLTWRTARSQRGLKQESFLEDI